MRHRRYTTLLVRPSRRCHASRRSSPIPSSLPRAQRSGVHSWSLQARLVGEGGSEEFLGMSSLTLRVR